MAIYLIDRMGRRPLLLVGMSGIAISLLICSYGFSQATYQLDQKKITAFNLGKLYQLDGITYHSDVEFKQAVKNKIGTQAFAKNEGAILEAAIEINALLVLIGIIGFIDCFAFSLGQVMWVKLSELFPNRNLGLAIGVIGFVNSFSSWLIQQIFLGSFPI